MKDGVDRWCMFQGAGFTKIGGYRERIWIFSTRAMMGNGFYAVCAERADEFTSDKPASPRDQYAFH
jgi:hypothetical protein